MQLEIWMHARSRAENLALITLCFPFAAIKSVFRNHKEFHFWRIFLCPAPITILRFNQHRPDDTFELFLAGSGKLLAKPLQTELLMDLLRSLQPSAWGCLIFGLKAPYLDLAARSQFWLQVAFTHGIKLCGILFGRKGIFFVQNRSIFSARCCIWRFLGQIRAFTVQTALLKASALFPK